MSERHVFTLSAEELAEAMRETARGYYLAEAATELLIAHRSWLCRPDFRHFIDYQVDEPAALGHPPMAWVKWDDAVRAELPASSSEVSILRIAASIARGVPLSLHDELVGLDAINITAVVRAVVHANGDPRLADAISGLLGGEGR